MQAHHVSLHKLEIGICQLSISSRARVHYSRRSVRLVGNSIRCFTSTPKFSDALDINPKSRPQVPKRDSERIHVLGVGSLGKFFAHSIARSPNAPPITLLLHRQGLVDDFVKGGRAIDIVANGTLQKATGFDYETINPDSKAEMQAIANLIVATKTIHTLRAVSSIKHRLTAESTLLFIQNGMGTVDEVNEVLFPNPKDRPSYLAAIISHGVYSTAPFSCVHAGFGTAKIGLIEDAAHQYQTSGSLNDEKTAPRPKLLDLILSIPVLSAREYPPAELINIQLEKLVMNALLNPLTAIFRVKNGILLGKPSVMDLMHVLVREASCILIAFLGGDEAAASRFGEENVMALVIDLAEVNFNNTSSMLHDVRNDRQTEIDYINGWLVKKGDELGIGCENHKRLMRMVEERREICIDVEEDIYQAFPDARAERALR